jgi:hypothetical protein
MGMQKENNGTRARQAGNRWSLAVGLFYCCGTDFEFYLFIFFKIPPTLGSVKSSIPHNIWRFYFLGNFIFPKFRVDLGPSYLPFGFLFHAKMRSLKIPQVLLV